mmetsp:Transcript_26226/g.72012  ORF Transcript_26226/g.72012 Transcript_26226/m.72012 type:complete len:220 (-) Transcript_26226:1845-2504(-)
MLSASNNAVYRRANHRCVTAICIVLVTLSFTTEGAFAFLIQSASLRVNRSISVFAENCSENFQRKNQQQEEDYLFGSGNDLELSDDFPSDEQISSLLNRKIKELDLGIGKRYITRTQRGFLNVHYEVGMQSCTTFEFVLISKYCALLTTSCILVSNGVVIVISTKPSDPYMVENVVNQLSDGQIVTATGPKRGIWIPHDGGGWSVSKYEGFTWLEPIDE